MERVATDLGRFYLGEGFIYPSVTTIIDSSDRSGIEFWKRKVGEVEAERISTRAKNRGTVMHSYVENHFFNNLETEKIKEFNEDEISTGINLFEKMKVFFDLVEKPLRTENYICHPTSLNKGYCGAYDFEAIIDGKLKIVDFKSASKNKEKKYVKGYYEQLSAYCHAYYFMYKEFPLAEIWLSPENGEPQRFVLDKQDLKNHYCDYLKKLNNFYSKNLKEINKIVEKCCSL